MDRYGKLVAGATLTIVLAACPAPRHPRSPPRDRPALSVVARALKLPRVRRRGPLSVVAGFELVSRDRRFGGLSGLELDGEGGLLAVSDRGRWLRLSLVRGPRGELRGLGRCTIGPLLAPDGRALAGDRIDAEALTVDRRRGGGLIVSFEQHHRLWNYRRLVSGGRPRPLAAPRGLGAMPKNGGIEALAALPGGRLLMISERLAAGEDGALAGWVGGPTGGFSRLRYATSDGFVPTDLAALDDEVLAVERRYTPATGVAARIVHFALAQVRGGARLRPALLGRLDGWLPVDNFEGLAVERRGGQTSIYIVSDDNFSEKQRTLLYQLAWLRDR